MKLFISEMLHCYSMQSKSGGGGNSIVLKIVFYWQGVKDQARYGLSMI